MVTVQTRGDGLGGGLSPNDANEAAPEGGFQTRHYGLAIHGRGKTGFKPAPAVWQFTAEGRRVSNPPLRFGNSRQGEGGFQTRHYGLAIHGRGKAGFKPATTVWQFTAGGRRVSNPPLRQSAKGYSQRSSEQSGRVVCQVEGTPPQVPLCVRDDKAWGRWAE